jgi:DNA-binding NarL/FixJ family response regulator
VPAVRLLIADDHSLVRLGLRHLLEEQAEWKVVADTQDGHDAVRKVLALKPDVAILDLAMPRLNGFEACRQIVSGTSATKVLILSMHDTDVAFKKVLDCGARGYLLKSDASRDLVAAVEAVQGNKIYFTEKVWKVVIDGFLNAGRGASQGPSLSSRQREIVQLIAEGKSNKEVSSILNISEQTARTHRANVLRLLNTHSVTEVVRYAIRNRIVES